MTTEMLNSKIRRETKFPIYFVSPRGTTSTIYSVFLKIPDQH